jgi:hypothetical protein
MRKKTVRIAVAMFRRGLTVSAAALQNSSVDYGKTVVPTNCLHRNDLRAAHRKYRRDDCGKISHKTTACTGFQIFITGVNNAYVS